MDKMSLFDKNWEKHARTLNIEKALLTLKKECTAAEGSTLDNAYDMVFQDLMAKLLEIKNLDNI